jgi:hypothetical protein
MGPFKKRETSGMPISRNPVLFPEQEKVILEVEYNVEFNIKIGIQCTDKMPE